jgi:hypothetical protein
MTKEEKMHQDAIELMDDINHRLGTNHWMSLDEFNKEFKHQFTNEEKEKVNSLLNQFEELDTVCRNGKDWDKCNCC